MWDENEQKISNAVIQGRKGNTDKYKPGVKSIYLVREISKIQAGQGERGSPTLRCTLYDHDPAFSRVILRSCASFCDCTLALQVFSDRSTANVFRFPYYNYYKAAIEPLLIQVKRHSFTLC